MAHAGNDDSHGGHGHGDSHGQEGHGGHDAAHAVKPGVAAYAPSEEAKKRWWAMPFDSTTNFSLLGLFLGWIMDRNDRKVDFQLK